MQVGGENQQKLYNTALLEWQGFLDAEIVIRDLVPTDKLYQAISWQSLKDLSFNKPEIRRDRKSHHCHRHQSALRQVLWEARAWS